jgi:hypothetical protein
VQRYYLYDLDLGEYEFVDVKHSKQIDIKLSEVTKLNATEGN